MNASHGEVNKASELRRSVLSVPAHSLFPHFVLSQSKALSSFGSLVMCMSMG